MDDLMLVEKIIKKIDSMTQEQFFRFIIEVFTAYLKRDAAPVRHGRWVQCGDGVVCCSECGEEHEWQEYRAPYCDICGAKMDGGKKHEH